MTAPVLNRPSLRTFVADGNIGSAEHLQILLATFDHVELVGTAQSGYQAIRMIAALAPDLVVLSVNLSDITGLQVAVSAQNIKAPPAIIFVSRSELHAVRAFELAAVDYLLKPVSHERLSVALQRVADSRSNHPEHHDYLQDFWIQRRDGHVRLAVDSIALIEAQGDYALLHAGSNQHMIHMTIEHILEQIDPAKFIRIHRSTIVRRDQISAIRHRGGGQWSADLVGGICRNIGKKYLAEIKAFTVNVWTTRASPQSV
jgi:DNA-binding LytR/AlgR family response regulator